MTDIKDTPAYLEELAATLASHGSNLAALRMAELEQRIAPSLAAPGLPTVPTSHDGTGVAGKVSLYADVSNALADPTFDSLDPAADFYLTTSWQALSPYWEARYVLDSGPAPSAVKLYVFEARTNPHNDANSSQLAIHSWNVTGSAMSGALTVEIRSRPVTYNSGYASPFFVGAIRALSNYADKSVTDIEVQICDIALSDEVVSTSGMLPIPFLNDVPPARYSTGMALGLRYFYEAYLVIRTRVTYVDVPSGYDTGLMFVVLSEPQLVQSFSTDPPPFSPNLGMWPPARTGWVAPTGTASRASFATDSVTLINLARTVKALVDDLTLTGLIGPDNIRVWGIATDPSATGTANNATTTST